ncbi:MAG: PilZ domain-containing protein [Pseudomonadota bacterium]
MAVAIQGESSPAAGAAERRTYFRVSDAVALGVTLLEDDEVTQFSHLLESRKTAGENGVSGASAHMIWRNIDENYPDIAAYLVRLEQRLDALQEQIGSVSDSAPNRTPTHTVNISGSGLHFDSETAYFVGQMVRVNLRLFPSGQTVDALARVVREHKRATPAAQGKFGCALEFVEILDSEREALLQHIHTLQLEALRMRSAELD